MIFINVQALVGKVILIVFWDSNGVIHTEYFEKRTTINSVIYQEILKIFKKRINSVSPNSHKFLLHHNNVWCHCNWATMETFESLQFEVISYPPYSPDLASWFFFRNLENISRVKNSILTWQLKLKLNDSLPFKLKNFISMELHIFLTLEKMYWPRI